MKNLYSLTIFLFCYFPSSLIDAKLISLLTDPSFTFNIENQLNLKCSNQNSIDIAYKLPKKRIKNFFCFSEFDQNTSQFLKEDNQKKRQLLIIGCARSGTTFISKFFQLNGLDLAHESDGVFGVVSWTMGANSDATPWGPGFNNYKFKHIFHQIRDPLKVIASAGNEPNISWVYIKKFIPEINLDDPKIVKGAKYWYYWNLICEKKSHWSYKIEDLENHVDKMGSLLKVTLKSEILKNIPKSINTRGYKDRYTWDILKESLDQDLFDNIVGMAKRYGYDTNVF